MIIEPGNVDPSWVTSIAEGKAVLWLGPSTSALLADDGICLPTLEALLEHRWAAIYVDDHGLVIDQRLLSAINQRHQWRLRGVTDDPRHYRLAANSVPIYFLQRGPASPPQPTAQSSLRRLSMLESAPQCIQAFVLGVESEEDAAHLIEGVDLSASLRSLVIAGGRSVPLEPLDRPDGRIVRLAEGYEGIASLLVTVAAREERPEAVLVRMYDGAMWHSVDITSAVDPGHPVTDRFQIIQEADVLREHNPTTEDLRDFLHDPSASWIPYAAGIPFPRDSAYRPFVERELRLVARRGSQANRTVWLPAEDGSGASTALRSLVFTFAREGFPVLLARRDTRGFDYRQISIFLKNACQTAADRRERAADVPWIIAFDAQHVTADWGFVSTLAQHLQNLLQPALVLALLPARDENLDAATTSPGAQVILSPALSNRVTLDKALELGEHLNQFLPAGLQRHKREWGDFIADTARSVGMQVDSLFWVALRFWLFRYRPAQESIREWVHSSLMRLASADHNLMAGLLEVCAFGIHRISMPRCLLEDTTGDRVWDVARDTQNPLGFRIMRPPGHQFVALAHPLIATEILRIASQDQNCLLAVDKKECLGPFDLKLHLLERIVQRDAAGRLECLPAIESLATSALDIDPFKAPANFEERDRIVCLLEHVPDSVFDGSQVFNHHLAIARRHLAVRPPKDPYWTEDTRREQFQLAERHMLDALRNVIPDAVERREAPQHLWVSLARIYEDWSRFERDAGNATASSNADAKAENAYSNAMSLDPDNPHLLENRARRNIRIAEQLPLGADRCEKLVEAVDWLEREMRKGRAEHRAELVLEQLGKAMEMLEEGEGAILLRSLAHDGSEPANIALARLFLWELEGPSEIEEPVEASQARRGIVLRRARDQLLGVPDVRRSWRWLHFYYTLISELEPHRFSARLEVLEQLDQTDYIWPLQERFEYAILLHQLGRHAEGKREFEGIREGLRERSSSLRVPRELRFVLSADSGFSQPLKTEMVVASTTRIDRNVWGIPQGWGHTRVPFRLHMFPYDRVTPHQVIPCCIQFTFFGPQAVPVTYPDE